MGSGSGSITKYLASVGMRPRSRMPSRMRYAVGLGPDYMRGLSFLLVVQMGLRRGKVEQYLSYLLASNVPFLHPSTYVVLIVEGWLLTYIFRYVQVGR